MLHHLKYGLPTHGRLRPLLFAALAGFLAADCQLFAQGGGAFGGGTTTGGGFSSFGSLGTSSFGNSSFGQSGFGGSSLGTSSFGQSGFGGTTTGTGAQFNTITNTYQDFVGRRSTDLQTFFGTTNQGFQNATTRSSRAAGGGDGSSSEPGRRPEVRVSLSASRELRRQVAGARPRVEIAVDRVATRLARRGMEGVSLSAVEGVATLEGVVESDSQRLLAEKLAAIEPGVRRVDNRLQVVPPPEEIYPLER